MKRLICSLALVGGLAALPLLLPAPVGPAGGGSVLGEVAFTAPILHLSVGLRP